MTIKSSSAKHLKVVFIGPENVGKTTLIEILFKKNFSERYNPTVGLKFFKYRENIEIWDTSGKEEFKYISFLPVRDAQLVFLCFDITNPESLKAVEESFTSLSVDPKNKPAEGCQFVLVATKIDKFESKNKNFRMTARNLAQTLNIPYVETSAKKPLELKNMKTFFSLNKISSKTKSSASLPPSFDEKLTPSIENYKQNLNTAVQKQIDTLNDGARWYTRGKKEKAKRLKEALDRANNINIDKTGANGTDFESFKADFLRYGHDGKESLEKALEAHRHFSFFSCCMRKKTRAYHYAQLAEEDTPDPVHLMTTSL